MRPISEFLKAPIRYSSDGQDFWSGKQIIAQLRGWGKICKMHNAFNDEIDKAFEDAEAYQDAIGQFIAEAINEKLERLQQGVIREILEAVNTPDLPKDFAFRLLVMQEESPPEFQELINKHFWELFERDKNESSIITSEFPL